MKKDTYSLLVLAPQPFYDDRGTPIVTKLVLNALTNENYKVDLLTFPGGSDIEFNNLIINRVPNIFAFEKIPIGFSIKKLVLDIFLFFSMWKKVTKNHYDVIYAIEESAFLSLSIRLYRKIPVIYDMQSCLTEQLEKTHQFFRIKPIKFICRYLESQLIKKIDCIICSKGLHATIKKVSPKTPVYNWIYPGLPVNTSIDECNQLKQEFRIDDSHPVIIYTGNAQSYQGIDLLLKSAELVFKKSDDFLFLLVGVEEGIIKETSSKNIINHIQNGRIRCIPRQPRTKISLFLSLADIAISPRQNHSNLPLKIFDYLQHGLPMIITDIPTHREVLDDSLAQFVNSTPDAMAAGILELLSNPVRIAQLQNNAYKYAECHLSFESFQSRISDIIKSTIESYK